MSWRVHDLYCEQCDRFEETLYDQSSGRPGCGTCGGDRRVAWQMGSRTPATRVFKPLNLGYTTVTSQAELNAEVARIERRHPGHHVDLTGHNAAESRVVAEEHFHRARESRKAVGVEERMLVEYKQEQNRTGAEAARRALSANVDPKPAAKTAVDAIPPLRALVQGAPK